MKKNLTLNILAILTSLLLLTGCSSSLMTKVPIIEQPDSDKALVTILRPSWWAPAMKISVWDGEKFLGVLTAQTYTQFQATPGHHMFMARSENWSGVDAELQAGKRYFMVARIAPGNKTVIVIMAPIGQEVYDKKQVDEWINGLSPMGVIPEKAGSYSSPKSQEKVRAAISNFESGNGQTMHLKAEDGV